jgi:hypothetical protein
MFNYSELQQEVKRSAVRDKAGSEFDTAVKNSINRAINRISREARWRALRRESSFDTVTSYTEGTGACAATEDSADITVTGATFITDGVEVGRRIDVGGSSKNYRIKYITGETTITLDQLYDGDTATDLDYEILPQGTYNLPMRSSHHAILWHEQYGHPMQLGYITSQESFGRGLSEDTTGVPSYYRMWGEDAAIMQPRQASIVSVVSSSASDTSGTVTIFGTVSSYPDYETINLNGTTIANGAKQFTHIERIVTTSTARVGRVTVSANSGEDTLAVLPVGATVREVKYHKVQIRPLPTAIYPINCYYYKIPYLLVNDEDVHELGSDFDNAIIFLATSIVRGETSQEEATTYLAMYVNEIKSLKRFHLDKIDWLPRLNKGTMGGNGGFGGFLHPAVSYGQIGGSGSFGPTVR